MTRILLKVAAEHECFLVPMQIELNLREYLDSKERQNLHAYHVTMTDKKTGRTVPCQLSLNRDIDLKVTLSWILLNEAQKTLEVEFKGPDKKHPLFPRYGEGAALWDRGDGQLEVFLDGQHVTSYVFNEAYERPFLYPVIGPDGLPVTRSVPCLGDHPHHKGIGLALGDVSGKSGRPGIDFWGLGVLGDPTQGRVIHQRFTELEQGAAFALIEEENVWRQNDERKDLTWRKLSEPSSGARETDERILLNETRTITIWNVSPFRIIDIHTVLTPAVDEVILNADVEKKDRAKENGPLTIRVADSMRGTVGGVIVNSEGGRTENQCWGRRARWVDYYGPVTVGGPVNGIAAMDHPNNLRHPTAWHVRDYGLFAANPFYDKKPEWPDQGPVYLSRAKGERLDLRYRIYIHRGDEKEGEVEQKWWEWVNPPEVSIE